MPKHVRQYGERFTFAERLAEESAAMRIQGRKPPAKHVKEDPRPRKRWLALFGKRGR